MKNVTALKVIPGDKIEDLDWLWELPVGSVFFCKYKGGNGDLYFWKVAFKWKDSYNKAVRLEDPERDDLIPYYVDSQVFSSKYIHFMTIAEEVNIGPDNTVGEV